MNQQHPLEQALAYRIHRVSRLLRVHLLGLLGDANLTPEAYFVLIRLNDRDGRRMAELCDPLLDERPNITRIVDRLVKRGLVRRESDPNDRRGTRVFLAAAGQALLKQLMPVVLDKRHDLFGQFSPADLNAIQRVLSGLEATLSQEE